MSQNKYYTPEMDELVEGCDIEVFDSKYIYEVKLPSRLKHIDLSTINETPLEIISGPEMEQVWYKVKYNPLDFLYIKDGDEIVSNLDLDNIRIKYLDRDDVESFNFDYQGRDSYGFLLFKKTIEEGINTFRDMFVHLSPKGTSTMLNIKTRTSYQNSNNTMSFNIKNKNEFKKLLKQLKQLNVT